MRVADWLMEALKSAGVRHVFMVPGGGAMHLNDALAKSGLAWTHCFHEQSCGIAAEAYGRIAGNLGVAMVTTGPGATNILTPVVGAWIESSPLMVISGQVKRADMMNGAKLRQRGPQEVDVISMVRGVTKYAVTVEDPQDIRMHFEKALHLATTVRPGPVWLEIPLDVQAAEIDPERLDGWEAPLPEPMSLRASASLLKIIEAIDFAERPLILAGHGVRIAGAVDLLRRVAESYNIPVATTWNALDLLPYDHPLAVGRPGAVAMRAPNFAIQNCDLLVSIGARLDNVVTAHAPELFARNAKLVVVDVDQNELDKGVFPATRICSDAAKFLKGMLLHEPETPFERKPWLARIAGWKETYGPLAGRVLPESGPPSVYQLVDALSDLLPEGQIIATGSSGMAVEAFYSAFRNKEGQRVFLTSGLGAMGYGLPAAIGACIASGKPIVLFESDGSLMFNIQELATIKALNLPIAIVVANNGGYGSIRNTQRNYFGRYIASGPETGVKIPELCDIADGFAIESTTISCVKDLRHYLKFGLTDTRPILIDVRLMTDESLSPKVAAITQSDGSMLSMPLEDMSPLLPLETLRAEMGGSLLPESIRAVR